MSYILEALQKSQKNRDDSKVPTLGSIPDGLEPPAGASRGRYLRYLPVAAGLALVVVGASWWLARTDEPGTLKPSINDEIINPLNAGQTELAGEFSDAPAEVLLKSQSVPEAIAEPPIVELRVIEAPVTIGHVVEPGSERTAIIETQGPNNVSVGGIAEEGGIDEAQFLETPVSDVLDQGSSIATVGVEPVISAETQPLAVAVESSRVVPRKSVVPTRPVAQAKQAVDEGGALTIAATPEAQEQNLNTPAAMATTQKVTPVQPVAVAPERSERSVKHFRELPYDVQQSLPEISYSVHLYSPAPENRMVKINGLMRREGDNLSDGLVLEEITSTGAIFSFRGHTFRVPVNG